MTKEAIPVLDAAQVADLMGLDQGRGALYSRFVAAFVAGAGERIARLGEQARAADAAGIAGTAHAFAGSAGNVGAARLAGLLLRIEAAAKRRDVDDARALVALLEAEYTAARDALRAACPANS
jgi:histidine phosphotransfer protein HptB